MDGVNKRFEDYETVNCDSCSHYWNDTCDGTKQGVYKPCTAFVATKRIDLPLRVQKLENRLKTAHTGIIVLYLLMIFNLLLHLVN